MFFLTYFKGKVGNNKREKTASNSKGLPFKLKMTVVVLSAAIIALLCVGAVLRVNEVPDTAHSDLLGEYSLLASTDREREEFFLQFGYRAEQTDKRQSTVHATGEIFEGYRQLLSSEGLDIAKYSGKLVSEYVFRLYSEDGSFDGLYAVMTVYKDRVIAVYMTDFSASADETAEMMPLKKAEGY